MNKGERFLNWQVILGISLITLSAVLYFLHYVIFKDAHHIVIYLLGDIAFVPIEVLLVTLLIHRLLEAREKRAMLKKLNMVIGVFFSEVSTVLLKSFSGDVKNLPDTDYTHLAGDIKRAYVLLIIEWLAYMKHLKEDYPYLFSLAVRTNPLDPNAEVEVR